MSHPVAIVTGAGSGIGQAVARKLAQEEFAVVLVGRDQRKLQETAVLIRAEMGTDHPVMIQPTDITDAQACQSLITTVDRELGRLDVLANVAGYAELAFIPQTSAEMWRQMVDTNLSSVVYLTKAAWRLFEKRREGIIVNVSSMASIDPFPGFAAYAAAKAGVNMFTQVTAREGKAIGLRAVCIAPGAVETPMLRSMFSEKQVPASRCLAPEDVAKLLADFVMKRREFVPGETVPIRAE
jgi:NAD(P)-dependent dehydrogenase (short-subunit alcohol dehydrogenase family)